MKIAIGIIIYLVIGSGGLGLLQTVLAGISSSSSKAGFQDYVLAALFWPFYLIRYIFAMVGG